MAPEKFSLPISLWGVSSCLSWNEEERGDMIDLSSYAEGSITTTLIERTSQRKEDK